MVNIYGSRMNREQLKETILNGSTYDPTDQLREDWEKSGLTIDEYINKLTDGKDVI